VPCQQCSAGMILNFVATFCGVTFAPSRTVVSVGSGAAGIRNGLASCRGFGIVFFSASDDTGTHSVTEVTSETLLVDSPLFKCLAWVSIGCFPRYSYVDVCVFVLETSVKTSRTIKEIIQVNTFNL